MFLLLCPLHSVGHNGLSVCPVAEPNSRTKGHGKLKIGRKEAVTQVTRDLI